MTQILKSRQEQILDLLPWREGQQALADQLGISRATLKRDLKALTRAGRITTHRDGPRTPKTYHWTPSESKNRRSRVPQSMSQRLSEHEPTTLDDPSTDHETTTKPKVVGSPFPLEEPQKEQIPTRGATDIQLTTTDYERDLVVAHAMDNSYCDVQLVEAGHGMSEASIPKEGWLDEEVREGYLSDHYLWEMAFTAPLVTSETDEMIDWLSHLANLGSDVATDILDRGYDRDRALGLMRSLNANSPIDLVCKHAPCNARQWFHPWLLGKECIRCRKGQWGVSRRHQPFKEKKKQCRDGHEVEEGIHCVWGHPAVEMVAA